MPHNNLTESNGVSEWDPERYDIDDHQSRCLKCGDVLSVRQVAGGASKACRECGVLVWVM